MVQMILIPMALGLLFSMNSCQAQTSRESEMRTVGGPCQGCEALLEYGEVELDYRDTLPGFEENFPKLRIGGRVLQADGTTPAAGVIVYIYHTNRQGIYPRALDAKGWGSRHGMIRGWAKTGKDGNYEFFTFRPAAYPQRSEPEHIHVVVKEPYTNPYYLDSYMFDDDPLLTEERRKKVENRGGSGIMTIREIEGILYIERDLVLGLNITNY